MNALKFCYKHIFYCCKIIIGNLYALNSAECGNSSGINGISGEVLYATTADDLNMF